MNLLKDAAIETLKKMLDESSLEDIMYEINFISNVLDGLEDANNNKLITTEELLSEVDKWHR